MFTRTRPFKNSSIVKSARRIIGGVAVELRDGRTFVFHCSRAARARLFFTDSPGWYVFNVLFPQSPVVLEAHSNPHSRHGVTLTNAR